MSIEERSIQLEENKLALDREIKLRELSLKEREATRSTFSSSFIASTGAALTFIGGLIGAGIAAWSNQTVESGKSVNSLTLKELEVRGNLDLEKSKQVALQALERKKFETSLIIQAIKTPSRSESVRNLKFFVAAGFVSDDNGSISRLSDDSLPSIGSTSVLGGSSRDREPMHLHPVLREKVGKLLERLAAEGLTFEILEGFRSPSAQLALYAQGRVDDASHVVTFAKPWSGLHSFGLAADLVQIKDKAAYFGPDMSAYRRMHDIAKELGLATDERDPPHIQLADVSLADLKAGKYPSGGDATWSSNLADSIRSWTNIITYVRTKEGDLLSAPPPPPD